MEHQAPARDDVVSPSPPAPAHAVSAPSVSSPSTSAAGEASQNQAPQAPQAQAPQASQPHAPYPPANHPYPAYPYYGAGDVAAGAAATPPADTPKTFLQRLDAGEEYWKWKISLRLFLIIVNIIGIGAASYVTASGNTGGQYDYYYFSDAYIVPFCLITLGVSLIWCILYVLVLFLRKPPRAMHPGIAVGMDLVLWLALIVTILFSVSGALVLSSFGQDGVIYDYNYGGNYDGYYTQAANGTWVYDITYANTYYYNNNNKRAAPTPRAGEAPVKAPIAVEAITTVFATVTVPTPVSPVSSVIAVTPTPTEAPSAAAARRAIDSSSLSSLSSSYGDSDYDTYSDYDYDTYSYYDYYDTSESSSSTLTSTHSTSALTGSDLYLYTTTTRSYYRTTSAGEVFFATTTIPIVATVSRDCSDMFASCADEDKYVNTLWHEKSRRYALDVLIIVAQCIGVVTHFALFVWACVDTHRRNVARRSNVIVAMNVLQDMRNRGYVMVPAAEAMAAQAGFAPSGQAYTYPTGYAAVPPQQPMSPGPEALSSRAAEKAPARHYA